MRRTLISAFLAVTQLRVPAAVAQTHGADTPLFRSEMNEIVLDFIATDRRGRPILDLQKQQVSVTDNGARQEVLGFRLINAAAGTSGSAAKTAPAPQLITLVYDSLETDARRQARAAGLELLKAAPAENVYISIVGISQQLCLLQPFTRNQDALKAAIDMATSGKALSWVEHSNKARAALAASLPASQGLDRRLAELMLQMLKSREVITETARATIFGLLSLVRGQQSFPGRKALVYVSEGLRRPPHLDEPFRNVLSSANRANVSFYAVSALGVATASHNARAVAQMRVAAGISADAITRDDAAGADSAPPVSPSATAERKTEHLASAEHLVGGDLAETASRNNAQQALRDLAESTGGELIIDTNDFSRPMRRVVQELGSYYEVTYNPRLMNLDGSFRRTDVQVNRAESRIRARNGYYALPPTPAGDSLLSYELPMIRALSAQPLPREVAYHAAAVRFQPGVEKTQTSILVEVPMTSITFTEEPQQNRYRSRLSLVAQVKNAQGDVVQKFSHDLPLMGPLDKIGMAKTGRFLYKEKLALAPGRYVLETAVLDHGSNKTGARRAALVVPAPARGVHVSHIGVVRRFEPAVKDLDPDEPFQMQGGRITPTLAGSVYAVKGAALSVFFVVYPDAMIAARPEAMIEYIRDGAVVGRASVPLSAVDAQGRIACVMSSPADSMPPGAYEVRVVVKQGETAADERAFVTIEPAPR
jgi:VWFA-related protein